MTAESKSGKVRSAENVPGERTGATEVGSYFVSNYPPFSLWSESNLPEAEAAIDRPSDPDVPLGLYIHIPFCRKRCKFCYFRVYTDKNSKEIETYVDALVNEVALYRDRAVLRGRPLGFVYFGGGTPSFLSSRQLRSLVLRLHDSVDWEAAEEVTFECEPGTLSLPKLETLAEIGVTRLSLGVENFDASILEQNGRAHLSDEIYQSWEWIQKVDFPQVNIDLIAGMVGETDENWSDCVKRTLELSPDSVTIYQMELPFNTVYSSEILGGEQPSSSVASWETKRRWVAEAFEALEAGGYEVSSGYTMVKTATRRSFSYRDSLWHGADMLGTGVASFSHIGGVHFQNLDQFPDYVDAVAQRRLPLKRALAIDANERLIRELILQIKLGHLDAGYFREKFGREILEDFAEAFGKLRKQGYLDWRGDRIELTREGLIRVDGLLPEFFLPEHRGTRYT